MESPAPDNSKKHSLVNAFTFSSPFTVKRSRLDKVIASPPPSSSRPSAPAAAAPATAPNAKICYFNDPIHGNIAMTGLCLDIIDTKEFQRLRDLKQLGTCDYVYPGATHTRFSHSIGVAHYAEQVLRALMRHQPELGMTEADVLSVKVAGLCHDLGHGPFSHVFDGVFMARMHSSSSHTHHKHKHRHEDGSVAIFQHLLAANHLRPAAYGLSEQDLRFIAEIISGTPEAERRGRGAEGFYLYDIVNNARCGLDVDKLDYFQRDIHHTNVDINNNKFERFIEFGRVMTCREPLIGDSPMLPAPGSGTATSSSSTMICYPDKMVYEAIQLFALRYQLHQKVYTHKTVKKVEFMLVDALQLADPFVLIPGTATASHPSGRYRMSECYLDPVAMCNLTDSVVYRIETSTEDNLRESRAILDRIRRRQFYTCLGKTVYEASASMGSMKEDDIARAIVQIANSSAAPASTVTMDSESNDWDYIQSQDSFAPWVTQTTQASSSSPAAEVTVDDLIVEKMHIHYGMKAENPVNRMWFYAKDGNGTPFKVEEKKCETQLPRVFEEHAVRVFSRSPKNDMVLLRAFQDWCRQCYTASPFPIMSHA